jgi:cytochrome c553
MNSMKLLVLMSLMFVSALPVHAIAADPWSEKAIPAPVDLADYAGKLNQQQLESLIEAGRVLFSARFTIEDGVGRPMATQAIIPTKRKRPPRNEFSRTAGLDANACASCHNAPVVGGAGDFTANVFVSEGFQHSDFDTTDPQFSNERNTNHLMGAGLVELLAREMSNDLLRLRSEALLDSNQQDKVLKAPLISKGVNFGSLTVHPDGRVDTADISGVDHDLIIRPFSQKGVMTSLRQFTINALNHHHGMQASERFGPRWTNSSDFDEDGIEREITPGDISALVAWQATLPPPIQTQPDDQRWAVAATKGQQEAEKIGCMSCHMSYLPLKSLSFSDPGPMDAAGTLRTGEVANTAYDMALLEWAKTLDMDENGFYKIPLFGDLKRHVIADQKVAALGNELLSQRFVERNVFMTTELWGIASTAPYGHRGDLTTLREIIEAHGGDARKSRDIWINLPITDQNNIIAWLKTLAIQP